MTDWQTKSSEIVYETAWMKVRRNEVLNHNGKPLTFSFVEIHNPSVSIVAVNDAGEVLLQRIYRYTVGHEVWEIPAGFSEGEDLLAAAKRELLEETGMISDDWTRLGTFNQAMGIGNIPFVAFLARGVQSKTDERDKDEQITKQQFKSMDEIEQMVVNGEFQNAPVLAVLYTAKIRGL